MKIILLRNIDKLGKFGNFITVKNGYARNWLIPKGLAILATEENIKKFNVEKDKLLKKRLKKLKYSQERLQKILLLSNICIQKNSHDNKKIFGSVGTLEIAKKITELGIIVESHEIKLPNGVLRYLGKHKVIFNPCKELSADFFISIISK